MFVERILTEYRAKGDFWRMYDICRHAEVLQMRQFDGKVYLLLSDGKKLIVSRISINRFNKAFRDADIKYNIIRLCLIQFYKIITGLPKNLPNGLVEYITKVNREPILLELVDIKVLRAGKTFPSIEYENMPLVSDGNIYLGIQSAKNNEKLGLIYPESQQSLTSSKPSNEGSSDCDIQ